MRTITVLAAGALAISLSACSNTPTEPTPSVAQTTQTSRAAARYADPTAMLTKLTSAGVQLSGCGAPFYDVANTLTIRCSTVATPAEQVALATFERQASGDESAKMLETNGKFAVHSDNGWLIAAATDTTVRRLAEILAS